jgi:hypothetical protein
LQGLRIGFLQKECNYITEKCNKQVRNELLSKFVLITAFTGAVNDWSHIVFLRKCQESFPKLLKISKSHASSNSMEMNLSSEADVAQLDKKFLPNELLG